MPNMTTIATCHIHGGAFTHGCPGCKSERAGNPKCTCGQGIHPWHWCGNQQCPIMDAIDQVDELWQ